MCTFHVVARRPSFSGMPWKARRLSCFMLMGLAASSCSKRRNLALCEGLLPAGACWVPADMLMELPRQADVQALRPIPGRAVTEELCMACRMGDYYMRRHIERPCLHQQVGRSWTHLQAGWCCCLELGQVLHLKIYHSVSGGPGVHCLRAGHASLRQDSARQCTLKGNPKA